MESTMSNPRAEKAFKAYAQEQKVSGQTAIEKAEFEKAFLTQEIKAKEEKKIVLTEEKLKELGICGWRKVETTPSHGRNSGIPTSYISNKKLVINATSGAFLELNKEGLEMIQNRCREVIAAVDLILS